MKNSTILRTLTDTTHDSVQGYRKASEDAKNPRLKAVLKERAKLREVTLGKLNAELARLGEEQVTSGTTAGWLHRKFTEVSAMFEGSDEAATERIEEGEDYIAGKFAEALKDDDLDPQTRLVIADAYEEVKQGERIADSLEAAFD